MPIVLFRTPHTRFRSRSSILSATAAIYLCLAAGPAAAEAAFAGAYHLRPQTKVKVMIVEWVASTGEYKEWTALNGEYVVSPAGMISIPLIGEISTADRTPAGLAAEIGDALKEKTGLASPPTTTVEVVKYPMIYVTGLVDKPGELEFKPGLTVMQAVAMAGGRERRSNPAGGYSDMEQIRYAGELSRYELQLKQLTARRARLQAELDERQDIEFPAALKAAENTPAVKQMMVDENALFATRAESFRRQIESLNELGTLLQNEIKVLDEKMVAQDRQIKNAEDELASIARLVSQQAVTKSRQTSLDRVVADLQSSKLDMVVASMRAKQKVSETQRDAVTLRGQRRTEIGKDLQATEAEIEDTKLKRSTTLQVLQVNGASLSRYASYKELELQPLEYWINHGGQSGSPVKVKETALLEPGDVLDVRSDVSNSVDNTLLSSVGNEQSQ